MPGSNLVHARQNNGQWNCITAVFYEKPLENNKLLSFELHLVMHTLDINTPEDKIWDIRCGIMTHNFIY